MKIYKSKHKAWIPTQNCGGSKLCSSRSLLAFLCFHQPKCYPGTHHCNCQRDIHLKKSKWDYIKRKISCKKSRRTYCFATIQSVLCLPFPIYLWQSLYFLEECSLWRHSKIEKSNQKSNILNNFLCFKNWKKGSKKL